jgi:hypothetical protein
MNLPVQLLDGFELTLAPHIASQSEMSTERPPLDRKSFGSQRCVQSTD